jgi:hypothetical protein
VAVEDSKESKTANTSSESSDEEIVVLDVASMVPSDAVVDEKTAVAVATSEQTMSMAEANLPRGLKDIVSRQRTKFAPRSAHITGWYGTIGHYVNNPVDIVKEGKRVGTLIAHSEEVQSAGEVPQQTLIVEVVARDDDELLPFVTQMRQDYGAVVTATHIDDDYVSFNIRWIRVVNAEENFITLLQSFFETPFVVATAVSTETVQANPKDADEFWNLEEELMHTPYVDMAMVDREAYQKAVKAGDARTAINVMRYNSGYTAKDVYTTISKAAKFFPKFKQGVDRYLRHVKGDKFSWDDDGNIVIREDLTERKKPATAELESERKAPPKVEKKKKKVKPEKAQPAPPKYFKSPAEAKAYTELLAKKVQVANNKKMQAKAKLVKMRKFVMAKYDDGETQIYYRGRTYSIREFEDLQDEYEDAMNRDNMDFVFSRRNGTFVPARLKALTDSYLEGDYDAVLFEEPDDEVMEKEYETFQKRTRDPLHGKTFLGSRNRRSDVQSAEPEITTQTRIAAQEAVAEDESSAAVPPSKPLMPRVPSITVEFKDGATIASVQPVAKSEPDSKGEVVQSKSSGKRYKKMARKERKRKKKAESKVKSDGKAVVQSDVSQTKEVVDVITLPPPPPQPTLVGNPFQVLATIEEKDAEDGDTRDSDRISNDPLSKGSILNAYWKFADAVVGTPVQWSAINVKREEVQGQFHVEGTDRTCGRVMLGDKRITNFFCKGNQIFVPFHGVSETQGLTFHTKAFTLPYDQIQWIDSNRSLDFKRGILPQNVSHRCQFSWASEPAIPGQCLQLIGYNVNGILVAKTVQVVKVKELVTVYKFDDQIATDAGDCGSILVGKTNQVYGLHHLRKDSGTGGKFGVCIIPPREYLNM